MRSTFQAAADEVATLERRYWRAVNELDLQLAAHFQDRDTILAKVTPTSTTYNCFFTDMDQQDLYPADAPPLNPGRFENHSYEPLRPTVSTTVGGRVVVANPRLSV